MRLAFKRAFGAHQRYWICGELGGQRIILGAFLFAAAAKDVAARDAWLGWTRHQQQRFRHRVVANSRMLILPGVKVPNLASHALSLVLRRLLRGLAGAVRVRPRGGGNLRGATAQRHMLPGGDTFVHVGQTTGRGRQDRQYDQEGTVREVFVYPLERNWRQALVAEESAGKCRTEEKEHIERSVSAGRDEGMITAEQRLNEMNEERIRQRYEILAPFLDEKQRR